MRLHTKIRRRHTNPNAVVEQNQEQILEMLHKQQEHDYEKLRLHFTGLILQGVSAHYATPMPRAIELAISRGREMTDAWIESL